MKKFFSMVLVVAMLVCMIPGMAFANEADPVVKVFGTLTSGATTAQAFVYDNYDFSVAIVGDAENGLTVSTKQVEGSIDMIDVDSMDIDHKHHDFNLERYLVSLPAVEPDLGGFLPYIVNDFTGGKVNYDVNGATGSYDIIVTRNEGDVVTEMTVVGDTDELEARAAWTELTSHIAFDSAEANSQVFLPMGTSVQIDKSVLVFTEDTFVDPGAEGGLVQYIQNKVRVDEAADSAVVVNLPVGAIVQLGASKATLNDKAVVTVEGIDVEGILDGVGDAAEDGTIALVKAVLGLVDGVAKGINNETITVSIDFEEGVGGGDEPAVKVFGELKSGATTAQAFVYDNYNFEAIVNAEGAELTVNPQRVEGSIDMINVPSLGVNGVKHHDFAFDLSQYNLPEADIALESHLPYIVKSFTGGKVNYDVNGKTGSYDVVVGREVNADKVVGMTVTGTTDETAARAAWTELTSHISHDSGDENSQVIIPAGTTVQIGKEVLEFENNATVDPSKEGGIAGAVKEIQDKAYLKAVEDSAVVITLPVGAELQVGASKATLDDKAVVTVEGITVDGILSDLRDAANGEEKAVTLVKYVLGLAEDMAEALDGGEITVKIEFPADEDDDDNDGGNGGWFPSKPTPSTPAEPEVDADAELKAKVDNLQLVARSEMSSAKGKKAVKVRWYEEDGDDISFLEGYEVFRSVKRFKGYGTKPFFTTEREKYWNTDIEEGMKYFYKVRGYVTIDGEKYYTDWSLKAWRTVE